MRDLYIAVVGLVVGALIFWGIEEVLFPTPPSVVSEGYVYITCPTSNGSADSNALNCKVDQAGGATLSIEKFTRKSDAQAWRVAIEYVNGLPVNVIQPKSNNALYLVHGADNTLSVSSTPDDSNKGWFILTNADPTLAGITTLFIAADNQGRSTGNVILSNYLRLESYDSMQPSKYLWQQCDFP